MAEPIESEAEEWARLIAEAEERERELEQKQLLAEYVEEANPRTGTSCLVCNSPNRKLIDEMLRRGGGGLSISHFLRRRLNESIGETSIRRHNRSHLDTDNHSDIYDA